MTLFELEPLCAKCSGTGKVWSARISTYRICDCAAARLPAPDVNPEAPAGIDTDDDVVRLNRQQALVWAAVRDGDWHTLYELSDRSGVPTQSISARLRDLRKRKYGEHTVERESLGHGLFRYRLIANPHARMQA